MDAQKVFKEFKVKKGYLGNMPKETGWWFNIAKQRAEFWVDGDHGIKLFSFFGEHSILGATEDVIRGVFKDIENRHAKEMQNDIDARFFRWSMVIVFFVVIYSFIALHLRK